MDFGYENEVVFPFGFEVAKSAKPGSADLHAKVDWLVCREVCIPGKADLALPLCRLEQRRHQVEELFRDEESKEHV